MVNFTNPLEQSGNVPVALHWCNRCHSLWPTQFCTTLLMSETRHYIQLLHHTLYVICQLEMNRSTKWWNWPLVSNFWVLSTWTRGYRYLFHKRRWVLWNKLLFYLFWKTFAFYTYVKHRALRGHSNNTWHFFGPFQTPLLPCDILHSKITVLRHFELCDIFVSKNGCFFIPLGLEM